VSDQPTYDPSDLRIACHAAAQALRDVGETCVPAGDYRDTVKQMYELGRRFTELAYELDVAFNAIMKSREQNGNH
jgi:hypothetical protein